MRMKNFFEGILFINDFAYKFVFFLALKMRDVV